MCVLTENTEKNVLCQVIKKILIRFGVVLIIAYLPQKNKQNTK